MSSSESPTDDVQDEFEHDSRVDGTEADGPSFTAGELVRALDELRERQTAIEQNLEMIARVLEPIASRTYEQTQARVRALEKKVLSRQERPTINRLHELSCSVQRLSEAADAKTHLEEALLDLMSSLGYEHFGRVGDAFEDTRHEVVAAVEGADPTVSIVHAPGLESFGDVVVRARVEVAPIDHVMHLHHATQTTQQEETQ